VAEKCADQDRCRIFQESNQLSSHSYAYLEDLLRVGFDPEATMSANQNALVS
jgi:hypothetical protein